jgi:hypothetical protein
MFIVTRQSKKGKQLDDETQTAIVSFSRVTMNFI